MRPVRVHTDGYTDTPTQTGYNLSHAILGRYQGTDDTVIQNFDQTLIGMLHLGIETLERY